MGERIIIKTKIQSFLIITSLFVFITLFMITGMGANTSYQDNNVYLPIIMYHSLLKETKLQNDFIISPSVLEKDLKYFSQNGYSTVTVNDLVEYVYSDKSLPEKFVMITFDDGFYNNYYYAYPLLKKYKCKAIISPIASLTEKYTETGEVSANYGYLSVSDINEMLKSGCVEIQNHTYNMHSLSPRMGVEQKNGESVYDYTNAITADIIKAQKYFKENTGVTPNCFVYPFGAESSTTLDTLKKIGFVCTLTCTEKPNVINKNPESLFELGRYRRNQNESVDNLMKRIEKDLKK